ncbi:AAA family ATPase [Gammaproteobacteria bacterium]|nr:AAA family ATPase [Gammaproteobacteria bacterium]
MVYIKRKIASSLTQALQRGKSVLLLGARQTGKTTLINHQIKPNISYSFARVATRQRYEQNTALLESELEEKIKQYTKPPVVFIDEVQKIPRVMDVAQHLIDDKLAQFILTGSSARKLKTGKDLNLLPGRVVSLTMTPLLYDEIPQPKPSLEDILLYGALPGMILEPDLSMKDTDLYSYVTTYLEEEIRAEAMVRNLGSFSRFIEIAAGESGKQINFTRLSQDIGIADTTIANYYQILEDCLITLRIDPVDRSTTKRRLIKSPKYLFFDMGVRRACANEGTRLSQKILGDLFEQYVGTELVYYSLLTSPDIKIKYWRDSAGPEVDYVIDQSHKYTPIEVKWTDKPNLSDAKHLKKFIEEYAVKNAYIICRTPHRYRIAENIIALPWQEIGLIFSSKI